MAGRRWAGAGQLCLSLVAFGLIVGWFVLGVLNSYNQVVHDMEPRPVGWLGEIGACVFAAAWLWALATSVQLYRAMKENEPANVPPRLT